MTKPSSAHSYVTTIDAQWANKILQDLKQRDFEITIPTYTYFCAKKQGLTCTLYTTGKLVIQGKGCADFVEFYLEPEILKTFNFRHPLATMELTPRIGIDESGKGDFFGPLCIAGVYVSQKGFQQLHDLGVKDSKTLTDSTIQKLGQKIKECCLYHIVKINPLKYNQIYADFKNLNRLLAWGHATAIEQLIQRTNCPNVIIDQFADEWVVEQALKRKNLIINLTQRHRAEEDLAVAAASILARQAFLEGLHRLSEELGFPLPKGGSKAVIIAGQQILQRWGEEKFKEICKLHFKNLDAILEKERQ